jgi:hypothetical protein
MQKRWRQLKGVISRKHTLTLTEKRASSVGMTSQQSDSGLEKFDAWLASLYEKPNTETVEPSMTKYRLAASNIPTKLPVVTTMVVSMFLDFYEFESFAKGVAWTFMGLYWVGCLSLIYRDAKKKEVTIDQIIGEQNASDF